MMCFIKMLYVDIQNCASCGSGVHIFRKNMKQVARKLESPKSGNVDCTLVFVCFEGSRAARVKHGER